MLAVDAKEWFDIMQIGRVFFWPKCLYGQQPTNKPDHHTEASHALYPSGNRWSTCREMLLYDVHARFSG
jgi:hypothetical protein